ncbi:MAG: dTMP kinase, partial [Burkholderiales bacterium]|nr:dTMP kinase [Burkholderiales bacterium]
SLGTLSLLERMVQTGIAVEPDLMLEPDLTLWFDVAPAVAAERLALARAPDRFEAQDAAFFERVAQGYAARAQAAPERFVRIDGAQSRHTVWQQLTNALVRRGWLAIMVAANGGPK